LREAIQKFAFQPRFGEDFNRALPLFFGEEVARTRTLVADEEELPEFQEWYFFDYPTSSGEAIIDIFAREEGDKLTEKERELLDLWRRWNRYRLFEVQKVMPGTGVVVEDLLSGETLEVHDRSASHSLTRWTVFLARPFYTDRLHFTGSATGLLPMKKKTVYYRVADGEAVAERLDLAEEFNFAGPSGDRPGALHFNWLLRGRSHVPEQPKPEREVMIHDTQWFLEAGSPNYRSLGDVSLWPNKLELSCMRASHPTWPRHLSRTLSVSSSRTGPMSPGRRSAEKRSARLFEIRKGELR
jgi:hypothetical protein